jgi:hypothetical protein
MKRLVVPILALSLTTIACGSDATGDPSGTTTLPPADEVVLTIGFEGGFAPVDAIYDPLPIFVLFSDGRLVSQGPTIAIFPGPILPNLQVAQLSNDEMAPVTALVDEIGLPDMTDERDDNLDDAGNVADASDTVFTYFDDSGEHRYAIYALGITETPTQMRHSSAQELVDLLSSFSVSAEQLDEYEVERLHIVISEDFGASTEDGAVAVPWPLSTPVSEFDSVVLDLRCKVFEGEAATEALEALSTAHQLTFWEDGGVAYRPTPRPLFPAEPGCPAQP